MKQTKTITIKPVIYHLNKFLAENEKETKELEKAILDRKNLANKLKRAISTLLNQEK